MTPSLFTAARAGRISRGSAVRVPLSVACLLFAAMTAMSPAQMLNLTDDEKAVAVACDARDARALSAMFGRSAELDARILLALGSVQSVSAVDAIVARLSSPTVAVRAAAAFALGQTLAIAPPRARHEKRALDLLKRESDPSVRAALVDAIGRFGTKSALASIAALDAVDTACARAQAASIARFAIRGIRSKEATDRAAALVARCEAGGDAESFNPALYALMRIADSALLAPHTALLTEAAQSRNPQSRMLAVSALGRVRSDAAIAAVLAGCADADWRVRVNALRAASAWRGTSPDLVARVRAAIAAAMRSDSSHIALTAYQAFPAMGCTDDLFAGLLAAGTRRASSELAGEAMAAYCRVYPDRAAAMLADSARNAFTVSPLVLRAIGLLATREAKVREELRMPVMLSLLNPDPAKSLAAMESWIACFRIARRTTPRDQAMQQYATAMISGLTYHSESFNNNTAAVQLIADAMRDSLLATREFVRPVMDALKKFTSAGSVETVMSLIDCLGALGGREAVPAITPWLSDPNPAVRRRAFEALKKLGQKVSAPSTRYAVPEQRQLKTLDTLPAHPVVTMTTSKGVVRMTLFTNDAPFTSAAFLRLANTGFYNGLTFHRVVPNFVVQGGDPKGDGTGGPPFTLRSEFSPRMFLRGIVGIASAGKDTEGSQFFIMHSAAPHLDGKYTVLGEVTEGMDVVDRLEVGDRILRMTTADR